MTGLAGITTYWCRAQPNIPAIILNRQQVTKEVTEAGSETDIDAEMSTDTSMFGMQNAV